MSIRLSDDEAWAVVADAHTGILTTLRRDGMPVTLPMWFVALDRTVCFSAPSRTKKVARLRHDDRAAFLVESGLRWAELRAVHMTGHVEIVADDTHAARIGDALDTKYASFRTDSSAMPSATRAHYSGRTFFRLQPDARMLTWDNARLELGG
jgi:nitroimidazol reductase NimA-like FMN-containing flavoprotein (pyridoxamine 5'-phosphate oxidase superfamily)